jgi:hypothetical protein
MVRVGKPDYSSLRDNGWEWFFFSNHGGLWTDPETGESYSTDTALLIQEERKKV